MPSEWRGKNHTTATERPFFQKGMQAYVEQRYPDAAILLERAVEAEPTAADANIFLAICRLMQGKVADSVAPLKVALTNEDSVYTQSAHFYLAKAYIQTGDLDQAEAQLQAAATVPGGLRAEASSDLDRLQALRRAQQSPEGTSKPQ